MARGRGAFQKEIGALQNLFAAALLAWSASAFAEPVQQAGEPQPGLVCTATDGTRQVCFIVPTANFTLLPHQSIHPQLEANFSAQWSGALRISRSGEYTIRGEARVLIEGQEVQNRRVLLRGGDLPLRIEYRRKAGSTRLQFLWESDHFKIEPIPATVFVHWESPPELAKSAKLARGRELIEEFNCIACHKTDLRFFDNRVGPDLSTVGSRLKANWIYHWLENPRSFRATALMPALLKSAEDRADVTAYLASLVSAKPLPQVAPTLPAKDAGERLFQNLGCPGCHAEPIAPLAGLGSKMNPSQLVQYLRFPLVPDPSGRMPDFSLSQAEAVQLASYLAQSGNVSFESSAPRGDAARGKRLAASVGCLNCHTIKEGNDLVSSTLPAPPLNALRVTHGCLTEHPAQGLPRYEFAAQEREALAAFLQSQDVTEAPVQDTYRLLKKFSCNACHELNGPAQLALPANQTPPPLSNAGNKLRRSWIDAVLNQKKRVRPWMALRMPHYGAGHLNTLLDGLAACAGAELGEGPSLPTPSPDLLQAGIHLIGKSEGSFACISCHDYRGHSSGAEMRGPDMTEMSARIRADWFRRWLRDPARIIPGTAMPSFFSALSETETETKIDQLIGALSAGKQMPIPAGLQDATQPYWLRVTDEPILLRCFLPDSSARSIAVGLPGGLSYCFDALSCRLRYAWSGDFLNVKPTWADRGAQPPQLLGVKFFVAPEAFPLRIGRSTDPASVRFLGYELVQRIPEFHYEVNGSRVRERITVAKNRAGLIRSFRLEKAGEEVWFQAPPPASISVDGNKIKLSDEGWGKVSGRGPIQFEVFVPAPAAASASSK